MSILSKLILMAESNDTKRLENVAADALLGCIQEDDKKPDFKSILKLVKTKAVDHQTGLSCDEIKQTARSVSDGRAIEDIKDLVVVVVEILPKLAHTLPQSLDSSLERLTNLPNLLHDRFNGLKNNRSGIAPDEVKDLFERLYSDPSAELLRETLIVLLENDTLVTALVVYANLHQVPIEKQDVAFLRDQLDDPGIDMAALVEKGKARLKEKYEIDKAEKIMAKLQALRA